MSSQYLNQIPIMSFSQKIMGHHEHINIHWTNQNHMNWGCQENIGQPPWHMCYLSQVSIGGVTGDPKCLRTSSEEISRHLLTTVCCIYSIYTHVKIPTSQDSFYFPSLHRPVGCCLKTFHGEMLPLPAKSERCLHDATTSTGGSGDSPERAEFLGW